MNQSNLMEFEKETGNDSEGDHQSASGGEGREGIQLPGAGDKGRGDAGYSP